MQKKQTTDYLWPVKNSYAELDRQMLQHTIFRLLQQKLFTAPVDKILTDGAQVLDVGTGPGTWALEAASEYPKSTVTAIDIEDAFPNSVYPSNCIFEKVDARERLPYVDGRFDFINQRIISMGFKTNQWVPELKELKRVLKVGGWVQLTEPALGIERAGPTVKKLWGESLKVIASRGSHSHPGHYIRSYAEEAGFSSVSETILEIPLGRWGGNVGDHFREDMILSLQNFRPFISAAVGAHSREVYEEMLKVVEAEWEEHKAFMKVHVVIATKN